MTSARSCTISVEGPGHLPLYLIHRPVLCLRHRREALRRRRLYSMSTIPQFRKRCHFAILLSHVLVSEQPRCSIH